METKEIGPEDWTPERVKVFWDHWYRQRHHHPMNFSKQVGRGIVRYLRESGALGGDILDYGCGWGDLSAALIRKGGRCWGCDWSIASVRAANHLLKGKRGWRGAGVIGDPAAPYRQRRFDLVTCIETIEHVPESREDDLFTNLHDVTKPGGSIFVTTPNDEDLTLAGRAYCPFCSALYHPNQHVRSFDAPSLTTTIEKHGFRVRWTAAVNFGRYQAPPWPGLGDISPRYFAKLILTMPHTPLSALYKRRHQELPHLCALAVKEPSKMLHDPAEQGPNNRRSGVGRSVA
jgi:2-polyprenyl-3-methyl-5-hydroxy-6-metoxy-1,4-benzoquinol methylase